MKRIMLVLFGIMIVLVFLGLGNAIFEKRYEKQVDSEIIEYIIE